MEVKNFDIQIAIDNINSYDKSNIGKEIFRRHNIFYY